MNFFKKIFITKNEETASKNDIPEIIEKVIENNPNEFYKSNFEEKYKENSFFIHKYCRLDGEWIEKGEKILIVRINEMVGYRFMSASILAEKSGVIENLLNEGDQLTNGTLMYKLHEKGKYNKENIIGNEEFKHFFYIDEPQHTFENWFKSDGDFVEKGEKIYQFKTLNSKTHIHLAEKEGFIDIAQSDKIYSLSKNELMYSIRNNDDKRITDKYINQPNIIFDEFNNSTIIKWHRVSSKFIQSNGIFTKSDNFIVDLFFSFMYFQNNDYIVFSFNHKQLKPKQNDKIIFLFNNNTQLEFELSSNPIVSKNNLNEKILEYKSLITISELELFANIDFKKWKISLVNDGREILGGEIGGEKNYETKKNLNIVIKKFAKDYMELVNKIIPNYESLKVREIKREEEFRIDFCYVYLMKDTSNGYYKIGISNKPKYREKTLQSEKPTIEMVISKKFPIRKIAESFEKSLHITYSDKRIRGEWFELSETDVKHIMESLK